MIALGTAAAIAVGALFLGVIWGLCLGLWTGERGRRRAAENREMYGKPEGPRARAVVQPVSAEERAADARGYSKETVKRGAEDIMAQAKAMGRNISKKDAMKLADDMLSESLETGPIEMAGM